MTVNADYLGRKFPTTEPYEVSRVKIADFAEAIGDRNPLYTDASAPNAAGYPDVIAPPTFPIVITMAASRTAIEATRAWASTTPWWSTEMRFTYSRPLHAGYVVVAQSTISGIREVGSMTMVTTETEIKTVDGEHVCTGYGTLVERGERMTKFADVTVGAQLPPASDSATRLSLVKYCGASGDFNFIHWNERIARSVGLPNVIAHGMFTMAQAGLVRDRLVRRCRAR